MSQFKVERVTKVKGLTDLSDKAKVGDKAELTAKRNRGPTTSNERPGSSNGKHTSVKKSTSSKSTTSSATGSKTSGQTSASHHSSPPKPAARTKQTSKTNNTKTCPASQQSKQTSSSGTDVSAAKKKSPTQGVTPVPRSRVAAAAKPSSQKTVKEPDTKKKNEIKKESSYDASDSDSERGSVDRLNADGDFGYETGSLDDSDVSTGELLSPSAKDEQKTILTPGKSKSVGYSYTEVEFRPLLVTDEGGIATRHPGQYDTGSDNRLSMDGDTSNDRRSYTYAGDEFRPLIVTEGGGIAAPVEARKSSKDYKAERQGNVGRPMTLAYEEVTIVDGGFDRSNIKVVPASQKNTPAENSTTQPQSDVYAVVQKKSKVADSKEPEHSKPPRQNSPMQRPLVELGDVVPAIPGGRKDSSMYEAIAGELQNMIQACEDVELEEGSSRTTSNDTKTNSNERKTSTGEKRLPPPIPRPYSGPGLSTHASPQMAKGENSEDDEKVNTEDVSQPVYAVVQKKPKDHPKEERSSGDMISQTTGKMQPVYAAVKKKPKHEQNSSVESLEQLRIRATSGDDDNSDDELPPPLPSRLPNLEDTMKRTEPSENVSQLDKAKQQPEEKSKKGVGLKIFKKKHRRQLSDGNVVDKLNKDSEKCGLSPSAGKKFNHRRSKSQADIMRIEGSVDSRITFSEVDIPLNKEQKSSDEKPPIKPYMEVDITEPPLTPTFLKKKHSLGGESDDQNGPCELPEGWREVKGDDGTYYWHVASGTTQWTLPQVATRPKKKTSEESKSPESPERQKVLSFPVHSMGWIELEENQVAPHNMSETIADCISTLAQKRKDLWNTAETWGEGKDIRLLLEGEALKLVEPRTKVPLLVQPVSKMRVWGVGKEDQRDFAYVARDPSTGKHKCHMFRCHGNISGRAITNALHDMCSKILEEKKKAQESNRKTSLQKPWSDIINTPPPSSARDNASFNEKPHVEPKKSFSAKYVGSIDVSKPTGVDILNKAINKLTSRGGVWRTILIEISVSNIRITDCTTQELISEDRVRFMSFFGVGKDERLCGYIVSTAPEVFVCHVFHCSPNAASLTKALAEACELRFQKCIDAHPEIVQKVTATEQEKAKEKIDKEKEKAGFMTSVQGFLGKLGPKKGGGKKEESSTQETKPSSNIPVITCKPSHTFMVKYYGALPVAVGTGIETVEEAAKHLAGGTLLICQLDVALNGVTLYDSQRSALSKRNLDADTISYCGLTSNRSHFGLIQSMGGGKYICHVFAEYKTKAGPIVAAIHETL
ncbi:unnamed protein product [Porites lobata]|uniref:Uncharacterized protein n=1 Tax=Porites lobata TaxID=104759 RepID=A0ABN8PRV7_9CNID|nr:unnamed protein product [Porites lobata]